MVTWRHANVPTQQEIINQIFATESDIFLCKLSENHINNLKTIDEGSNICGKRGGRYQDKTLIRHLRAACRPI